MSSRTDLRIPHLDQWFGMWAMEEARFWAGFEFMRKIDLHLHMQSDAPQAAQAAAESERKAFRTNGSIAIIGIHGQMMKQVNSMSGGTSTVLARRQLRAAAADPDIAGIALHIDSPGGTVAGTADLAADVAAAAARKPVYAYVEDLGASAAYWVASQATRISANASALVGSIGTYGVVFDFSGQAAMEGVKAHVVRAGKFKGMGVQGTEITQEHLAELQRTIDALNDHFVSGVAAGRKMSVDQVRELADGRVHVAKESKRLGLIDAVESFDQTFTRLEKESRSNRSKVMADHIEPASSAEPILATAVPAAAAQPDPIVAKASHIVIPTSNAATLHQIKAACIGADSAFILAQLEANATVDDARSNWMAEQNRQLLAARAEVATAKTTKPGVAPVTAGKPTAASAADPDTDPIAAWEAAIAVKVNAGMSRQKAIAKVAAEQPELHAEYIAAYNAKHGRKQRA